jgi:hypothetical protein
LEGQALQTIVLRKHLCANGMLLLHELTQTYKPKNVPEVIAAKTGTFWSQTKRLPSKTVDNYNNHFQDLLDELSEADEPISTKSAMHHFIFTLGAEFSTIQNKFILEIFLLSGIPKIGQLFWYYVMIFITQSTHRAF